MRNSRQGGSRILASASLDNLARPTSRSSLISLSDLRTAIRTVSTAALDHFHDDEQEKTKQNRPATKSRFRIMWKKLTRRRGDKGDVGGQAEGEMPKFEVEVDGEEGMESLMDESSIGEKDAAGGQAERATRFTSRPRVSADTFIPPDDFAEDEDVANSSFTATPATPLRRYFWPGDFPPSASVVGSTTSIPDDGDDELSELTIHSSTPLPAPSVTSIDTQRSVTIENSLEMAAPLTLGGLGENLADWWTEYSMRTATEEDNNDLPALIVRPVRIRLRSTVQSIQYTAASARLPAFGDIGSPVIEQDLQSAHDTGLPRHIANDNTSAIEIVAIRQAAEGLSPVESSPEKTVEPVVPTSKAKARYTLSLPPPAIHHHMYRSDHAVTRGSTASPSTPTGYGRQRFEAGRSPSVSFGYADMSLVSDVTSPASTLSIDTASRYDKRTGDDEEYGSVTDGGGSGEDDEQATNLANLTVQPDTTIGPFDRPLAITPLPRHRPVNMSSVGSLPFTPSPQFPWSVSKSDADVANSPSVSSYEGDCSGGEFGTLDKTSSDADEAIPIGAIADGWILPPVNDEWAAHGDAAYGAYEDGLEDHVAAASAHGEHDEANDRQVGELSTLMEVSEDEE